MTRTYAVKYKSKSKMLTTPEQVAKTEEDIKASPTLSKRTLKRLLRMQLLRKTDRLLLLRLRMRKISNRLWTE